MALLQESLRGYSNYYSGVPLKGQTGRCNEAGYTCLIWTVHLKRPASLASFLRFNNHDLHIKYIDEGDRKVDS